MFKLRDQFLGRRLKSTAIEPANGSNAAATHPRQCAFDILLTQVST